MPNYTALTDTELKDTLRKAATCIYLGTDSKEVADDIAAMLRAAITRLERMSTVEHAMNVMRSAINSTDKENPGSYRDTWIANIAMPINEQRRRLDFFDPRDCNRMANMLVNHFFGTVPSAVVVTECRGRC